MSPEPYRQAWEAVGAAHPGAICYPTRAGAGHGRRIADPGSVVLTSRRADGIVAPNPSGTTTLPPTSPAAGPDWNIIVSLPEPSAAAISALAPTGTLRAAINLSNFLLVTGRGRDGNPEGVSPDMARTLATQLRVGIELIRFKTPGELADAATAGVWDVGNIGAEPARAEQIAFTAAYCEIEATYLVPAGSDITSVDEVDRPGRRIASADRSAYGLWLDRNIEHAELINAGGLDGSFEAFSTQNLDALAGLRPRLITDAERLPGSRVLDGRFTAVQQAMGTPRDRDPAGVEYLLAFVEAAKGSGLVAELIAKHRVAGLSVAPAA